MINVLGMLYFSCLLLAIGNHLNNITIPLRMNQSGFDETMIGIIMSAIVKAVDVHGDLMRMAIASAGEQHAAQLGAGPRA